MRSLVVTHKPHNRSFRRLVYPHPGNHTNNETEHHIYLKHQKKKKNYPH